MTDKAEGAFRTISEVSEMLAVPAHVLRFWESKFSTLRPLKRSGGRRYYRPDDVHLLQRIRDLLYTEGFTIKGAQKHLSASSSSNRPATDDLAAALSLLGDARTSLLTLRNSLNN